MSLLRQCRVCGEEKPLTAFGVDRKGKHGRSGRCNSCNTEYSTRRYRRIRHELGTTYTPLMSDEKWEEIEKRGWLICRGCGKKKALNMFRPSARKPRVRRKCRACDKTRRDELNILKRDERQAYHKRIRCQRYGLTPEDYDRMLEEQQGRCAICRKKLGSKRQTIDHCHRTGRVRGIVHAHCNLVIGNAKEDVDLLRGAIAYLQYHVRETRL